MPSFRTPFLLVLFTLLGATSTSLAQTVTVVYNSPYEFYYARNQDNPPGLIQAADGNFYGYSSGYSSGASIFRLTPAGTYTTLVTYTSEQGQANSLIQGPDGNFYGTTEGGGASSEGSLFRFTPPSTFTTLYSFDDTANAPIGITLGADGNFYVVASKGAVSEGAIFKFSLAGSPSQIYAFGTYPGLSYPDTPLLQASDGNFYGATLWGGSNTCSYVGDCGTIYELTPGGSESTVLNLAGGQPSGNSPFAWTPVEGLDSNIYDTTSAGGANADGSFVSISSSNDIYDFDSYGSMPNGLILASDGQFYGTSEEGGYSGLGSIFSLSTAGVAAILWQFNGSGGGSLPVGPLLQAADGTFYGFTQGGGTYNGEPCDACGTIFNLRAYLPPPVQVTLSASTAAVNEPVTLNWQVLNAASLTMQQCYAFTPFNASGGGTWTGKQTGTMTNNVYQGSASITPTVAGVYTYALTCGGVESASAILRVGGGKAATATALQTGGAVLLGSTATLTATPSTQQNIATLTGSVSFSSGSTSLGSVSLTNGSAVLNVAATGIATGTYPVTATYSGDANYQSSSVTSSIEVVGYATSTTLNTSATTVTQGQPVTLTANVARTSQSGTPTGSVRFYYGSAVLATVALKNGTATYTAATNGSIAAGVYSITATYLGDSSDQSSASPATDITVNVLAATTTSLQVSPAQPIPANTALTLTATVKQSYNSGTPTGTVKFASGSYQLGSGTLVNGTVAINTSDADFPAGTYPVTATYSGDAYDAASSATVNVVVQ